MSRKTRTQIVVTAALWLISISAMLVGIFIAIALGMHYSGILLAVVLLLAITSISLTFLWSLFS